MGPPGHSLLGMDLSLRHESSVSVQLSGCVPVVCESLSAQWVTLGLPKQTLAGEVLVAGQ